MMMSLLLVPVKPSPVTLALFLCGLNISYLSVDWGGAYHETETFFTVKYNIT